MGYGELVLFGMLPPIQKGGTTWDRLERADESEQGCLNSGMVCHWNLCPASSLQSLPAKAALCGPGQPWSLGTAHDTQSQGILFQLEELILSEDK